MPESEHKYWAVMYNDDGHISMTPSDGKKTPFGTKMYKFWTVVSTDMAEDDARAYVRMNWKDMTPYSVAKTLRDLNPKYKNLSDAEFEALWKRTTLDEFYKKKDAFLAKEKIDLAAEEEREKQKKAELAALQAAEQAEQEAM